MLVLQYIRRFTVYMVVLVSFTYRDLVNTVTATSLAHPIAGAALMLRSRIHRLSVISPSHLSRHKPGAVIEKYNKY